MAGKGGRIPGAGRKKGSVNKKTSVIAERAAAEGITPLEVMLAIMREQWEAYQKDKSPEAAAAAVMAAKDAAPYMHARLQNVQTELNGTIKAISSEPLTEDEWERQYARADSLGAAAGAAEGPH